MEKMQVQFHLEEYRSLKNEVEYRVKATEQIELLVVVGIAGLYTWLSKESGTASGGIWWLPVVLVTLGAFRQIALLNRIMEITSYIREIENRLCLEDPGGWEHFLRNIRRSPRGHLISMSGYFLWILLLAMTVAIALNGGL
jgi:hypothetical protein